MEITDFTYTLLLVFFPGIIAARLFDTLTIHKDRKPYEFVLNAFVFGVVSYLIYGVLTTVGSRMPTAEQAAAIWDVVTYPSRPVDAWPILSATGVGVVVGLAAAITYNRKWVHRLARLCRITKKFGELDVWAWIHSSPDIQWVTVRDWENRMTYHGWVAAFSDTHVENELLLNEVRVFPFGEERSLYELDALYMTRRPNSLTIEIERLAGKPRRERGPEQ